MAQFICMYNFSTVPLIVLHTLRNVNDNIMQIIIIDYSVYLIISLNWRVYGLFLNSLLFLLLLFEFVVIVPVILVIWFLYLYSIYHIYVIMWLGIYFLGALGCIFYGYVWSLELFCFVFVISVLVWIKNVYLLLSIVIVQIQRKWERIN